MELRQSPRLRVRFRTSFSASEMAAGEGLIKDISLGGCRVETSIRVHLGTELELRIAVPQGLMPVAVDRAVVRWEQDREFGVAFLSLRPSEQEHLQNLLKESGSSPKEEKST